ncbi:Pentatricopeptide repeat-containing protein [Salvia divinorum]|uniref:Pentatricopeptide repeat-containing protein n=2 Tax=Salvia divinorum TaxID=28513 RepID=A0ABD1FIS6_SALDI
MNLSLLSSCKSLRSLQQLQAHATKSSLDADPLIAGKLLLHCAVHISDARAHDYAERLLRHAPNPDAFMYNAVIRGFSDSDAPHSSISTFALMLKNLSSQIDSFTLAFSLKSAANLRCLRTGSQLHCQALLRGLDIHIFVGTTLISMYAECGRVEFARDVFDEIPEPNTVTWNALLTAFFRRGDVGGAERVFAAMPAKSPTSYNLMLGGYTKLGEFALAGKVFDEMPLKDEVSWSTMILGLAQHGWFEEAFGYFRRLRGVGTRPNEVSLTGVLSACAQAGALEFAKMVHCFVEKVGLIWITPVNNALMDTYSKCGSVDMSRLVFERMTGKRSIVSWTTLITGLAMQGHGEEALALFLEMEGSGVELDGTAFVALLYACAHAGLVEEGSEMFDKMSKLYRLNPEIEHYGCMVDLYSRAGQLTRAYDFVTQMPIPPNDIIWRTLLGACSFHGNVQLAEKVKDKLSEMDPNNRGDRVLLSNIYAVAGKWRDAAAVRRSMAELKLRKSPGWSRIEVDKMVYTFVAGVREDGVTREAYEKLGEVMSRIRVEGGYVPEVAIVLHDVEEEEKEGAVAAHSEKLAVAFGMARSGGGRRVRVVKNLRVCRDCHNVMKLISKVYDMEIVMRDRSRFHYFKNGNCSCKDYW